MVPQILKYFECERSRDCCRQIPVEVADTDVARICKHLGLKKFKEFESKYLDENAIGNYLKMPCSFLDRKTNTCTIYEHRPGICRLYPFVVGEGWIWQIHSCPMGQDIIQKILDTFPTLLENSRDLKPYFEGKLQTIEETIEFKKP